MWEKIATAPLNRDIEIAVIDADGAHALIFPCRRTEEGWINAQTGRRIPVHPTHWRQWRNGAAKPN